MSTITVGGNFFTRLLSRIIPDRTKRLILLASLTAWLSNKTGFDQKTCHKLNTMMQLCNDDNALEFPMRISKVIWKGDSGNIQLYPEHTHSDLDNTVTRLVDQVPCWLRYSDITSIRKDISHILENRLLLAQ